MNRIEALSAVLNDAGRTQSERGVAARALEDIASTSADPAEREAARKVLRPGTEQARQDREMEFWIAPKLKSRRETCEEAASFLPDTEELLRDIDLPVLFGGLPMEGATERLNDLLMRTGSELVRQRVTHALGAIARLQAAAKRSEVTRADA